MDERQKENSAAMEADVLGRALQKVDDAADEMAHGKAVDTLSMILASHIIWLRHCQPAAPSAAVPDTKGQGQYTAALERIASALGITAVSEDDLVAQIQKEVQPITELTKAMEAMQKLADTFFDENGGYVEHDTNAHIMPSGYEDIWYAYNECIEILWERIKVLRAASSAAVLESADRMAYEGAREDLLDWKRRALAAEELNRKFIRSINEDNGPTFMGEPVLHAAPHPEESQDARRWKHKKRGTVYTEIGRGRLQTAIDTPLHDYAEVVVYRGEDGKVWVRSIHEFEDGRFEAIDAAIAAKE